MRTTVDIPDPLYRELKKKAAHDGRSIKAIVLRGIEREVRGEKRTGRRRQPPLIDSDHPGSLDLDNAKIYDLLFS